MTVLMSCNNSAGLSLCDYCAAEIPTVERNLVKELRMLLIVSQVHSELTLK